MQVKILKKAVCGIDTYGFEVETEDGKAVYEDICTDLSRIENLCELIKREEPELLHISELIEDFIFTVR